MLHYTRHTSEGISKQKQNNQHAEKYETVQIQIFKKGMEQHVGYLKMNYPTKHCNDRMSEPPMALIRTLYITLYIKKW